MPRWVFRSGIRNQDGPGSRFAQLAVACRSAAGYAGGYEDGLVAGRAAGRIQRRVDCLRRLGGGRRAGGFTIEAMREASGRACRDGPGALATGQGLHSTFTHLSGGLETEFRKLLISLHLDETP